jgi:YidC/Oxa1 family membrane protein insertase
LKTRVTTRLKETLVRLAPFLFVVAIAVVVTACGQALAPGASGASPNPTPTPTPPMPLEPATPGANPFSTLAWLFTPIFQLLFIIMVGFDSLTGNIAIAIILLTVTVKLATTPITRRQLVSTRRMQLLAPEVKAIQAQYKGDRQKQTVAVQEFYKQRGINQAGGCLPALLTMGLLIPMYQVISQGLTNFDVTPMLQVFGIDFAQIFGVSCSTTPQYDAAGKVIPCLDPWAFGINWSIPEPQTTGLLILGFGISILAIISALVQLVASRQALPQADPRTADDQNTKVQRQMAYFLPFISLVYGGFLPAGLFLYWIFSSVIQVFQQFLVVGFGGTFPLFGWYPRWAAEYRPRYHVTMPQPKEPAPGAKSGAVERPKTLDRDVSAQSTIRPNRNRQNARRGRRR